MKYYFILALLFPFQCLACSCAREPDFEKAYEAAEYVVEAKILKKSRFQSFSKNKFSLHVMQSHKGNPSQAIQIWTEKDTPSCGMDFNVNEEYIIFIYSKKGKLNTSRCSVMQRIGYRSELTPKFDETIKSKHL